MEAKLGIIPDKNNNCFFRIKGIVSSSRQDSSYWIIHFDYFVKSAASSVA